MGSTEMLHVFIGSRLDDRRPGVTGTPVPGYEAKIVDKDFNEVPRGTVGRLAVRGPTGCRYLADDRQREYVQNGWNVTGDAFSQDEDGYFRFAARNDDMIVSAGYNIAGPEVEAALLTHEAVGECAVIGLPDEERGQIVAAFVVLKPGVLPDEATALRLQNHVKANIAPYKYPRAIRFLEALAEDADGQDPALPAEIPAMIDDLFQRTRALFDLPKGVVYLDGNSLGAMPISARERVRRELDESWGRELIRAWNSAGWIDLPARVGDRIGALVGAPTGSVVAGDSTSINLFKALTAALELVAPRKVVLSDSGNFPTDLYVAEGVCRLLGRGNELKIVDPEAVESALDESRRGSHADRSRLPHRAQT